VYSGAFSTALAMRLQTLFAQEASGLDAQLGDLQVLRRIDVLAVEADRQACLLGQQVDPPVSDLGQLGQRRGLLYAGQRPSARMTPGDGRNPRCYQPVPLRSCHAATIERHINLHNAPKLVI
jgi:hypothetical protein